MDNVIAVGPMSPEVTEAVYKYSHIMHRPLMLIASKNQIDYKGGYVNNWTTKSYMEFIRQMRQQYLDSDVLICRDHCGPGFNGNSDLTDVYKTIETDARCGFDLIHIDFCHYKATRPVMLEKASEAIKYAKRLNPRMRFEIGTDEIGKPTSLSSIRQDIEYFVQFCKPDYYVVNTGSLVKETYQAGVFNRRFMENALGLARDYQLKIKEHNADYLSPSQIQERKGVIDAVNIAPEFGVRQTEVVIELAKKYGVAYEPFLKKSYESKKWKKWMHLSSHDDLELCATIAGHYNFTTKEYERVIKHLNDHINVKETLIAEHMKVIDRYAVNLNA